MVCNLEDLPEVINDREKWRERGSGISVLAARHNDDEEYGFKYPRLILMIHTKLLALDDNPLPLRNFLSFLFLSGPRMN